MKHERRHAELFLDGTDVGEVQIHGWDDSWGFGDFCPNRSFASFAPKFGLWSLLMHADGPAEKLSEAASDELRRAEFELDAMDARLMLKEPMESRKIAQLNIDGDLIEWREL